MLAFLIMVPIRFGCCWFCWPGCVWLCCDFCWGTTLSMLEMLIVCFTGIVSTLDPPLPFPALLLLMMRPIPPAGLDPGTPAPPAPLFVLLMMGTTPLGGAPEVFRMGLRMPIAGGGAAWAALSVGELNTFVMVIGLIVVGDPICMSGLPTLILGDPMWALSEAPEAAGTRGFGDPIFDAAADDDDGIVGDGATCPADDAVCDGVDDAAVMVFGIWIFGGSFLMSFWNGLIVDPVAMGDVSDWKWLFVFTAGAPLDDGVAVAVAAGFVGDEGVCVWRFMRGVAEGACWGVLVEPTMGVDVPTVGASVGDPSFPFAALALKLNFYKHIQTKKEVMK